MTAKVLIADDHALYRSGLRELIRSLVPDAVIIETESYKSTKDVLSQREGFDLVLVDLFMPDRKGFSSLGDVIELASQSAFVVLSASKHCDDIRNCFECGVNGYIPKSENPEVISKALQLVLSGGSYVPPEVLKSGFSISSGESGSKNGLTSKQQHVLMSMVKGHSNKEIARELHMSEATVKAHVTGIFRNLNVNNRTQAVLYANQQGLTYAIS